MPESLQVALKNSSDSDQIYAYITGIALQHGGQRCILKADGQGLYFPENPPAIGSPLTEDCAIPLGPPGNTVTVTIPQMAGGRVWFSRNSKLTFLLNPGPALVEPSVLNPTDPNADVDFGFCEFTLNDAQLYANISYVDFVPRLPIAMSLEQASGEIQSVAGMAPDGIDRLADALREQAKTDNQPWDKLVVSRDGKVLRVLNATHGNAVDAGFDGYFEAYVEQVWAHFLAKQERGEVLRIDTQAAPGILEAEFSRDAGVRVGEETFDKPSTADILGCNTGPFVTGPSQTRNAIIPRLAAAFARSALLLADDHPSPPHTFYATDTTNHYARLVHVHNVDGKGYAFAYDDVQPDGGDDQSGKVNAGDPVLFTVTVGGMEAR
ncbi:glycoside hydrolase family 64 protein [Annulohypoxylon maeteangense]|uniref:glycoside hydrolase family 64 protein n=1 Tax=Annulohypoxylon maeteangense TaxID=1927788 RepID=UPI002007F157|nr:glycoside hydrolase family 64 protein [Annulohypoxylon maeteangense]KAI0888057.1 glycoside hydrolase family 64 protein [Annulohypoxylon maeteangense]